MDGSNEKSKLERCLEVALNPVGSLALRERLDKSRESLNLTFNIMCQRAVDLILSPYGFRVIESFLKANIDEVNVRLAETLSEEWDGLEEVLMMERGRYVCETLLDRELTDFAHNLIIVVPKDWWFTNVDALPILIKAISISEVNVASSFILHEQMELDLCDSPEGLYCVLKVREKLKDQSEWKNSLIRLILLKIESSAGSDALEQVILYGDYLVEELVEIIVVESYYDHALPLIVRLIENGTIALRLLIAKFLCEPDVDPIICRIRSSTIFDEFKNACDLHLESEQRMQLDACLSAAAVNSSQSVDSTIAPPVNNNSASMETTAMGEIGRKRKASELRSQFVDGLRAMVSNPIAKRRREEVLDTVPSTSKNTVTQAPTTSKSRTVSATPRASTVILADLENRIDPGMDVISMAMSMKCIGLISKLEKDSALRVTIFMCIKHGLLPLIMDEQGTELVKWFLKNGSLDQSELIENRVVENVDDLVASGKYGRNIVKMVIEKCQTPERKEALRIAYENMMRAPRGSSPTFDNVIVKDESPEMKVVNKPSRKRPARKGSSGNKADITLDTSKKTRFEMAKDRPKAKKNRSAPVTPQCGEVGKLMNVFREIDEHIKGGLISEHRCYQYITSIVKEKMVEDAEGNLAFTRLLQARILSWIETDSGLTVLNVLASDLTTIRPLMLSPMSSVLHRLTGETRGSLLDQMLVPLTCKRFIDHCLAGKTSSLFAQLFHSDIESDQCIDIAKKIVIADRQRFHPMVSSTMFNSIAQTEKGRLFIQWIGSRNGCNWKGFLKLLDPQPSQIPPK